MAGLSVLVCSKAFGAPSRGLAALELLSRFGQVHEVPAFG